VYQALSVLSIVNEPVPFPEYEHDPVGFIREVLAIEHLTEEQVRIAESVRDRAITNVPAGNGVGKDFLSAQLVLWFVFSVGGRVFTTAPTESQVKDILWHEIRLSYRRNRSRLGGECLTLRLRLSEAAQAIGFTAQDYAQDSFQGKHGEKLLLILDEANGISEEIDDAALSCVTGSANRLLRIGNPTASGTAFESACGHSAIRVPVWNHPNVRWAYTRDLSSGVHRLRPEVARLILKPGVWWDGATYRDENGEAIDDPVLAQTAWPEQLPRDPIPGAVSINWIEKIRATKGEGSNFWKSRCDAWFPTDNARSIIPLSSWLAARARYDADPDYWDTLARKSTWRHGLDVGDGGDPHARASWRGPVLYLVEEIPTLGDREDVGRAGDAGIELLSTKIGSIAVDNVGVGAGALSNIIKAIKNTQENPWGVACRAVGCNFGRRGEKAGVADENLNLRTQQYWNLRLGLMGDDLACAPLGHLEDRLFSGFAKIEYFEDSNGKIRIMDKDTLRKKNYLGRSPDIEDATVLAYNAPRMVKRQILRGGERRSRAILDMAPG